MNKAIVTSLTILSVLCTAVMGPAFNVQIVKASGTIYIRADGSIDPLIASIHTLDNVTYTLNASISDSIVIERNNIVVDGAGYTVQDAGALDSGAGIRLLGRSNVTLKDIDIKGFDVGIRLEGSSGNTVFGNNITNNDNVGIGLLGSNNTVSGNNITNNINYGVYLEGSNNTVSGNNITNNTSYSICLRYSSGNTVFGNNITANNWVGIGLDHSSGNGIYHNNFINNSVQVAAVYNSVDSWDDGYPSGGNYWSDYDGVDGKSGSNQDQPRSDDIGDTPYVIDSNNRDRYPLMNPWKVTMETDVNADGIVNIVDVTLVAKAFASRPRDPNWDERADIDENGVVNILDLGRVCKDFGKKAY